MKTILDFRDLMKDGKFLEKLKHCQLFKTESANEVHQSNFKECHLRCVGELDRWEGSQ